MFMSILNCCLETEKGEAGKFVFDFEYDSEMYWKTLSALKYRLTRKRILRNGLTMVEKIINWLQKIETFTEKTVC